MYRRILVTLDGSPLSEAVVPQVERFVAGTYTSVTMLRVAELPEQTVAKRIQTPMPFVIVGSGPAVTTKTEPQLAETRGQAIRRVKEEVETYLNEKARPLRAKGIEVESAGRLGHAAEEIPRFIEQQGIDLVAMASRSRYDSEQWRLGGVADALVESKAPVLLVPPLQR